MKHLMRFGAMTITLSGVPEIAFADDSLAKQLNNPVASLISFPIQTNFDFNVGPADGWRMTTNIQPVIPMQLNDTWNLISRTVLPIIYQEDVAGPSGNQFGLSDTAQSFFLSPRDPMPTPVGDLIWGAGPVISLPTSTNRLLGAGALGFGPTGVILFQQGPWTYGGLANHVWGVAYTRDQHPDVNNTFLQPFVAYTTPDAWTFSLNSELNYNWTASEWSGPINVALSKLVEFGKQPVSLQGRVRYWAAETDSSAQGLGFSLNATFVFPTK